MSYKGRIISVSGVIILELSFNLYNYYLYGMESRSFIEIIMFVLFIVMSWFAGKQYDKADALKQALNEQEKTYQMLFEHANDVIVLFRLSKEGLPDKFMKANQTACNKLGYTLNELYSMSPVDLTPSDRSDKLPEIMKTLFDKGNVTFEGKYQSKQGDVIPFEFNAKLFELNGERVVLSIARDISDRHQLEEEIRKLAYYDHLTGLPNRFVINKYLHEMVARARSRKVMGTVMFIDLDRFKQINDQLGHDAGDFLLQKVAERLTQSIREGDIVGRLSGDEFIVLLEDCDHACACTVAERILTHFSEPIDMHGKRTLVTPSIGLSFFSQDNDEVKDIIKRADQAMYYVKKQGRNNYYSYHHDKEDKPRS